MKISPVKTGKITHPAPKIFDILDQYLDSLEEKSIVTITSKIVSITQGDVVANNEKTDKEELIQKEADRYLNEHKLYPGIYLTITRNTLIASAGIDESNGSGYFVLWPRNAQETTNKIREHLTRKHGVKKIGVIITDSHTTPLRWGTTGFALAYSGFAPLKNYIGTNDLFNKEMNVTQANIADGLATSATVVMGEGTEQTPIAIITDVPFVQFQDRNPTKEELKQLKISLESDLYAPLIDTDKWKRGKASSPLVIARPERYRREF